MKRLLKNGPIKEEESYEYEDENCSIAKKSIKQEDVYKCELCSTVCTSISQLQTHTLSEHVPNSSSSTPSSTSGNQRVCCQQCEDTFENFAQFALHMKSHIGLTNSRLYFCGICPNRPSFQDKKSQLEHLTTQHIQMQVTQFICTDCESAFASSQALTHHIIESHRNLSCTICDFVTENEKTFKEHLKIHCRQVVMYGCALCTSAFSSQGTLFSHVQLTHDQDNWFPPATSIQSSSSPKLNFKARRLQCSVCDETVFGEDGLDDHRLKKHCKIRFADKCADCQEPLIGEMNFIEHCLRHATDHAHHCPVCRQSLRSDAQIQAHCAYHISSKNSEDSPTSSSPKDGSYSFVCPICGEKLDDGPY